MGSVGQIVLKQPGRSTLVVNVKPDITPEESAWLGVMMALASATLPYNRDFTEFIRDHNLQRHLKGEEDAKQ